MILFSVLLIILFGMALNPTEVNLNPIFPGLIWVGFYFSAVLGLSRVFQLEVEQGALLGLLAAPMDRTVLFVAKFLMNFLMVMLLEFISFPLYVIIFNYPVPSSAPWLLLSFFLGTLGFVSLGTFMAALAVSSRLNAVLLPLMLFPLEVPDILGSVQSTRSLLLQHWYHAFFWLKFLAVYDVIFVIAPLLLFHLLLEVSN